MILVWIVLALVFLGMLSSIWSMSRKDNLGEDIPWGEGKDLSGLLPSLEDAYKQTKMYELEQWWDRKELPAAEFRKKYPEMSFNTGGPVGGNNHMHLTIGRDTYIEAEFLRDIEKQFSKSLHKPPVILSSSQTFIPKNEHDFVQTMITGNRCDCDACTGTTNALDALKSSINKT